MKKSARAAVFILALTLGIAGSDGVDCAQDQPSTSRSERLAPSAGPAPEQEGQFQEYEGQIVTVDCTKKEIEIKDKRGNQRLLSITASTQIRGGRKCEDLKADEFISGGYTFRQGKRELVSIIVLMHRRPGTGADQMAVPITKSRAGADYAVGRLKSIDCEKKEIKMEDSRKGTVMILSITSSTRFERDGSSVSCGAFTKGLRDEGVAVTYELGAGLPQAKKVKMISVK